MKDEDWLKAIEKGADRTLIQQVMAETGIKKTAARTKLDKIKAIVEWVQAADDAADEEQ